MEIGLTIKLKKKETKLKLFFFAKKKTEDIIINTHSHKNVILINNKKIDEYFKYYEMQDILQTLFFSNIYKYCFFDLFIYINGGGLINQNKTIALALKRLFKINENIFSFISITKEFCKNVKGNGCVRTNFEGPNLFPRNHKKFIRIDYRRKERKKYGLKKARKASQYHKR